MLLLLSKQVKYTLRSLAREALLYAFGHLVYAFLHILGVIAFETPQSSVCVCYFQPLNLIWDWI